MRCEWCKKRKHHAFGLCRRCYHRVYYGIKSGRWDSPFREWTMPKLSIAEKAYLAGIIDGEGCIKFYPLYAPPCQITIANNDKGLLLWVQKRLQCGNIYIHKVPAERNHKTQYQWRVAAREQIKKLLIAIKPYLVIKDDQADRMLKYIYRKPYRGYKVSDCPSQILKVIRKKYANTAS